MALKARYVLGEAWSIARSGPRQTAMAVALIALALYVPGLLALLARNLSRLASAGGEAPAVVLTVESSANVHTLARRVATDPRVAKVRIVASAAALERFRRAYPDLGAALANLREAPFPPTLEIFLRKNATRQTGAEIAQQTRSWQGVETAESEEDFGRRFGEAVRLLRGVGFFLGGVLTVAAILSVASAIRLALDVHRQEIEIMRLMGATEGAVRAPFWLHASFEGLAGGTAALLLLFLTYHLGAGMLQRHPHPVLSLFWTDFLGWQEALLLPFFGTVAGLLGSVISLGRKP